jgi:3-deoxy-D-manno-octulosonate 8-phosphate phosphatase (KDO 8-P phosphatase)
MAVNENAVQDKLGAVRLIAMDVDGVLTDGLITLSISEPESKRFNVADGLGLQLVANAGLVTVWISGRSSEIVARRAEELGITHLYQGCHNKSIPLADVLKQYMLGPANIAYMGDDLNDLPAYSIAGVKFAPANAAAEIKGVADFVTERSGGGGAVREMCDAILKSQGKWNDALSLYLARLLQP